MKERGKNTLSLNPPWPGGPPSFCGWTLLNAPRSHILMQIVGIQLKNSLLFMTSPPERHIRSKFCMTCHRQLQLALVRYQRSDPKGHIKQYVSKGAPKIRPRRWHPRHTRYNPLFTLLLARVIHVMFGGPMAGGISNV